jgi:hypothetical protein
MDIAIGMAPPVPRINGGYDKRFIFFGFFIDKEVVPYYNLI